MDSIQPTPPPPDDDEPLNEFVEKGMRGITEVFMPHFWKELSHLSPEERAKAWCGFLSAGLGAMAADQGLEMAKAMTEGVFDGIEQAMAALQPAPKAKPSSLIMTMLDRADIKKPQ